MTAGRALGLILVCLIVAMTVSCAVQSASPTVTPYPTQFVPSPTEYLTPTPLPLTPIPTSAPTPTPVLSPVPTVPLSSLTLQDFPVLDGSTATIPLALGLIKRLTGCTEVQAEEAVSFHATDPSYQALADGTSDLLLVYPPAQPTIDKLDVFHTMDVREIGLDALVFIVNADNPVNSLTADQVRGIYSGTITNWKQVGGKDIAIVPFQRPELSGSQTLMLNLMMKDTKMVVPTTELIADSMGDIIDDVSSFSGSANAIGYSVYYYAKNMYTKPGLKFIAVDGVLPSNDTINRKTYGYTSPFYGVIPLRPSPQAKTVLDWLLSPDGQKLLAGCGYVPVLKEA